MATSTTTSTSTTRKAQGTTAKPVTTTITAVGTTSTTAEGTPMAQVPALAHLVATLGLTLANGAAAWPGYGKAVKFEGGTTAYVNRGNIDVRSTPANVAKWAKSGHGTVRGAQSQYLRLAFSATGTSK